MPKGIDYEIESSLNESYKRICEFEKYFYDKIIVENNGDLTLEIDKDLYSEIDNPNKVNDDFFQSTSYSSYKELFNNNGIPDSININDTTNSVQTVKDLSSIKKSTNASTQRYNEKKEQRKKERNKEQELEL